MQFGTLRHLVQEEADVAPGAAFTASPPASPPASPDALLAAKQIHPFVLTLLNLISKEHMNTPTTRAIDTLLKGASDPVQRLNIINEMIHRTETTSITDARDRMLLRILKAIALELRGDSDLNSYANSEFERASFSNTASTSSNGSNGSSRGSNGSSGSSRGSSGSNGSIGASTTSSGSNGAANSRGSNGSIGASTTSSGSNVGASTSSGSNVGASTSSGSNVGASTSSGSNGSIGASTSSGSNIGANSRAPSVPQIPDTAPQDQIATTTAILANLNQIGGTLKPALVPYFYTITRKLNGNVRRFLASKAEFYQPQKQKHSRNFMFTQFNAALEVLAALEPRQIDRIVFGKELSTDQQRSAQAATFVSNPTPFDLKDVASYDRKLQFLANWNVYTEDATTFLPKGQRQQFGGTRRRQHRRRTLKLTKKH